MLTIVLVCLLLTLNMELPAGIATCIKVLQISVYFSCSKLDLEQHLKAFVTNYIHMLL